MARFRLLCYPKLLVFEPCRNSFQTETDGTATTCQTVPVELEAEENNLSTSVLATSGDQARTSQQQDAGEDNFSAAAIDPQILQVIEAAVYDWRSRPWMATATTFKPEMVQAVWRCNPKWYSVEGSSTPNLKKISDRLWQLERQLRLLNANAVTAWEELQNYWTCAQAIANPQVEQAFSQASTKAKRQQLYSLYAQALAQPTGGVF